MNNSLQELWVNVRRDKALQKVGGRPRTQVALSFALLNQQGDYYSLGALSLLYRQDKWQLSATRRTKSKILYSDRNVMLTVILHSKKYIIQF